MNKTLILVVCSLIAVVGIILVVLNQSPSKSAHNKALQSQTTEKNILQSLQAEVEQFDPAAIQKERGLETDELSNELLGL